MEFVEAAEKGVIPKLPSHVGIGGSWSALSDAGEATNLNLVHLKGVDVTNVFDLTRAEMDGRENTVHALKVRKLAGFMVVFLVPWPSAYCLCNLPAKSHRHSKKLCRGFKTRNCGTLE